MRPFSGTTTNPSLWLQLVERGAIAAGRAPRWDVAHAVLSEAWAARGSDPQGPPVFGGRYIPPVLLEYVGGHGQKWLSVKSLTAAARDTLAYRLLWEAAPVTALQEYETALDGDMARQAYKMVFSQFRDKAAASMKGVVGDYVHKCILDLMITSNWMQESDITVWPCDCPGYQSSLQFIFPSLPRNQTMEAMWFVFREACRCQGKRRLLFPEVMALLCW